MKIIVAFPIIDLRAFILGETNRTELPSWSDPEPREFLRGHGAIRDYYDFKEKNKKYYCEAKNIFSFIDFQSLQETISQAGFEKFYVTKKIHVLRHKKPFKVEAFIEVILHINNSISEKKTESNNILLILKKFLSLKIEFILSNQKKNQCKLIQYVDYVAKIYLFSTTNHIKTNNVEKWWVSSGEPIVILENNLTTTRFKIKPIRSYLIEDENISVSYFHTKLTDKKNKIESLLFWEISPSKKLADGYVFNTLLVARKLIEVNIQFEAIKCICRNVLNKRIKTIYGSVESNNLQDFINSKLTVLNQKNKQEIIDSKISDEASISFYHVFSKTEINSILDNISNIRPQVYAKIKNFIYKNNNNLNSEFAHVTTMTLEQLKNKVRDFIGKAKIKEALDLLATWAHENNHAQLKTDIALFKSDFATLGREKTLGLVSSGESGTRQNKLTYSILNLLDSLSAEEGIKADNEIVDAPPVQFSKGKLKILMLTANPAKTTQLNLSKEHSRITNKLEDRQGQIILNFKQAVTKENFKEFTEVLKPDILHFSGHGENSVGDEIGGLVVQNDDRNGSSKIPPQGLKTLFRYFKNQNINLQAVILNACYSGEQAEAIAEHVQYVIGTTVKIGDTLAISFSAGFYFKLAEEGANIEDAFDSGRTQASLDGADESYFVIYKNNQKLNI